MATYTAYADYTIFFSDPAEFEFASSYVTPGQSLRINPVAAASLFGLTFPPVGGPMPIKGYIFIYPYTPNVNINHPAPSGVLLDPNVDFVTVPGQATNISPTPGPDMILYWSASIVFRGPEYTGADPTLIAAIPPRRWAIGFEGYNGSIECHPQAGTGNKARDASRVVDGLGLKLRGEATGGNLIECVLATSEGTGLPTKKSWERFYIRVRNRGLITGDIWRCTGSAGPLSGARLTMQVGGSISVFNVDNAGANTTTFGTIPALALDTWYRIDILVTYATGVLNGTIRVFVNGVLAVSGTQGTGSTGLGVNQNHLSTMMMTFNSSSAWEIDIDDWHNAEIPNIGGIEVLNSIDWLIGTHIKGSAVLPGTAVNWTGIIIAMNQMISPTISGLTLTSVTALATINLITNIRDFSEAEEQDATGVIIGPTTVSVSINGAQLGGAPNNGRLGYNGASGSSLTTVALGGAASDGVKTFLPSGSITPYPVEPLSVQYEKGNTANNTTINALFAACQYVGLWGPEDGQEGIDPGLTFNRLLHNCRYPDLGWTIMGPAPDAPVCVIGGTYVGNGTFQTITTVLPIHLLIIRNVTSGLAPVMVTTSMLAPQQASVGAAPAGDIPFIGSIPDVGTAYFTVAGTGGRVNQNLDTYEYFAFCDPGLRYLINGEFNHGSQIATYQNLLVDGLFVPEFAMLFSTVQSPGGIWMKGPRHTSFEMSTIGGALVTTGMQFGTGFISNQGSATFANNTSAYTAFRTLDGSALTMVQVTSYVGNGLASRVIPLTPLSGRFPLVAFVVPRNSGQPAIYRDPSHAGVNSVIMSNGGNIGNGITNGGTDSITVGSVLNANGFSYDVLVIPGSGSGWLNGVFCGPNGAPPGDFWEPDPEPPPPGVATITEGGLILGGVNPLTLLKDISGIYTLVPGKKNDTLYDRQTGQSSIDLEIPDPTFKTGYIGG